MLFLAQTLKLIYCLLAHYSNTPPWANYLISLVSPSKSRSRLNTSFVVIFVRISARLISDLTYSIRTYPLLIHSRIHQYLTSICRFRLLVDRLETIVIVAWLSTNIVVGSLCWNPKSANSRLIHTHSLVALCSAINSACAVEQLTTVWDFRPPWIIPFAKKNAYPDTDFLESVSVAQSLSE